MARTSCSRNSSCQLRTISASSASSAAASTSTVVARLRPHDHVQLRQRRFADLDGGVDVLAVQRALEHRLDALAHSVLKRSRGT